MPSNHKQGTLAGLPAISMCSFKKHLPRYTTNKSCQTFFNVNCLTSDFAQPTVGDYLISLTAFVLESSKSSPILCLDFRVRLLLINKV